MTTTSQTDTNSTQRTTIEQINSAVDNSFFYTNERFISNLDVNTIIEYLQHHYPLLSISCTDQQIKQSFLQMFANDEFMTTMLDLFNLSIFDFFKMLNSNYGILFKGAFLKKVKKEIAHHEYCRKYKIATNY